MVALEAEIFQVAVQEEIGNMLNNNQKYGIGKFLEYYLLINRFSPNPLRINWQEVIYSKISKTLNLRGSADNIGEFYFILDKQDLKYLYDKYSKIYKEDDKLRQEKRIQELKDKKEQIEKELEKLCNNI